MGRDQLKDEKFIAAVRDEFPNVLQRTVLPPEVPLGTPHLVLASSSSQLAFSATQIDFEVRFYGDLVEDVEQALEYVERKLSSILRGVTAIEGSPVILGLIGTVHIPFRSTESSPAEHILHTHLKTEVDPALIQDAMARLAVKVRDTYFVTVTLSNYELRSWTSPPIMPGSMVPIRVRPWDGHVDEVGLELTVDINNNLEGYRTQSDPEVTPEGIRSTMSILRAFTTTVGVPYAESGSLSVDQLEAESLA
jgi:hypothetical protein